MFISLGVAPSILSVVGMPLALAEVSTAVAVAIGILALLVGGGLALLAVRAVMGQSLARARSEATRIIEAAQAEARTNAEKMVVEAERAALDRKTRADAEVDAIRNELKETERRLAKREDVLERKEEAAAEREKSLSRQAEALRSREAAVEKQQVELELLVERQKTELLRIADMTREQARQAVLAKLEDEVRLDAAKLTRKITEEAEAHAKERAREITLMAIQRYSTEHTSEATVRAVEIPSDDMKGRIIGREGRNIRAIERATGADIIVDDTPGVIVVSCFDKVRQAVAVESLERLIKDGRLHPARIEEMVEKVKSEMEERIQKYGKDAVLEVNLRGVHPKIVEAMGKLYFRTSYGQNVLRHSIEVAYLCQIIAEQLGLDGAIARRCGFLHDIGKAMDHEMGFWSELPIGAPVEDPWKGDLDRVGGLRRGHRRRLRGMHPHSVPSQRRGIVHRLGLCRGRSGMAG
ncbi:Rnase Y domain-containing protein [Leptolyngbya sp. 15MV]|nr:Rnase Y domain-containing protein [Leptolyngbya sp. 15MV]